MGNVLFICTGNYYRSRFAEALFNHLCEERGLAMRAFSRGLATWVLTEGADISLDTVEALERRNIGLHLTHKMPTQLQQRDLESARRVIALKEIEHRPMMRRQFPDWEDKITYWHVHDIDVAHPEEALPEIEQLVHRLLDDLSGDASPSPSPNA